MATIGQEGIHLLQKPRDQPASDVVGVECGNVGTSLDRPQLDADPVRTPLAKVAARGFGTLQESVQVQARQRFGGIEVAAGAGGPPFDGLACAGIARGPRPLPPL